MGGFPQRCHSPLGATQQGGGSGHCPATSEESLANRRGEAPAAGSMPTGPGLDPAFRCMVLAQLFHCDL